MLITAAVRWGRTIWCCSCKVIQQLEEHESQLCCALLCHTATAAAIGHVRSSFSCCRLQVFTAAAAAGGSSLPECTHAHSQGWLVARTCRQTSFGPWTHLTSGSPLQLQFLAAAAAAGQAPSAAYLQYLLNLTAILPDGKLVYFSSTNSIAEDRSPRLQ